MQVRDLHGHLVRGYRTLNVIGVNPWQCYILYSKLYPSTAADFKSELTAEQQAVATVMDSLAQLPTPPIASWLHERGYDSVKQWGKVWSHEAHLVVRIYHDEGLVRYRDLKGGWQRGSLKQAQSQMRPWRRCVPRCRWASRVQRWK